ncbi:uncharacterized protein CLUP02_06395 [Colletotrichum lupini]|uniref:Uncharacterized protein n=1 Tax=Colletotrichum lupini TaxID=145971 RepID=A0A9Q8SP18_9PEZI|nr:uncharacterized protein CLUP02_06395 [Colletotrichum lupini]UQC80909.1 hypothetical protein CLUP02_06395 [Colletotrichum lupini]
MWRKRRTTGPKMGDYLRLQWPIMSVLDAALLGYLQELVAEGCVEKGCWSILSSSKRVDLKELDIKTPAYTNNYPCSYNSIAYVSWYHLTKSDAVSHHRHITSVAWIKGVYHGGRPWLELQDERPASCTAATMWPHETSFARRCQRTSPQRRYVSESRTATTGLYCITLTD